MSLLPNVGMEMEHSSHTERDDDDSNSSTHSDSDTEHPAVTTLDEVYSITEELQRQDEWKHHIEEQQRQEQEEIMRLRREELKARAASVQQRLHSTREPIDELDENTSGTTSLKVQHPTPFDEDKVLRINKKYAVNPWYTRAWHSVYNTTRFLLVSLSYTPGIDPNEVHAPREYYQREEYE
ncbi:uncharacterized protein TM35_000013650 [Trypanosoma theileri]|uniref:Uncharacterized protein n=1 Tax=Trypanosoma theileri TaxID=67003 RepID=A0A1X0P9C6_9TRYP|nr:uncharacterized protein TM35_000013650 [Trypanosoma theileri]ORC93488.1 hypothetical protein TM35_000013650 [Trypanosoma theileri]